MSDDRQYAPATLRNRDFILDVLLDVLPMTGVILESQAARARMSSISGETFGSRFPIFRSKTGRSAERRRLGDFDLLRRLFLEDSSLSPLCSSSLRFPVVCEDERLLWFLSTPQCKSAGP